MIFQVKYMYKTDFNYKFKYLNFLNYNKIIFVSSFENFDEIFDLYLITVKNKHVNSERAFQNSLKLYKSYVNDLDEIGQNSQINLLFMNNKLSLNAAVFFVCLTSSLVIKLLSCCFWLHSFLFCAMSCTLQRLHNFSYQ